MLYIIVLYSYVLFYNNDNDNDKPFSTRPFIGQDYIFLIFELGFG